MDKISVVSPCYNKAEYIGEFLQSVYDQVWDNIELILVNDGSTDGTREIIGQWEERFVDRGYSVRIIDQENLGVSAAVKAGLECVTGDYFCVPDCDDVLHPEYVSKMAGILIGDKSIVRVACDSREGAWLRDNNRAFRANYYSGFTKLEYDLMSCSLLERIIESLWNCMCRSTCLKQLIEAYKVDFRYSQEVQPLIVLAHIGNTAYLPEALYFYRIPELGSRPRKKDYASTCEYFSERYDIAKKVIKLLPVEEPLRNEFLEIANLGHALTNLRIRIKFNQPEDEGVLNEVCTCAARLNLPLKNIVGDISNRRWLALWRAISNYLIGYENPFHGGHYTPNKKGRIIGYGAYGLAARDMLPLAVNSPLKPDILWDRAQGDSEVMGIPVMQPDIPGLTPDDTVLVLIRNKKTAEEVFDLLAEARTENILYYFDILDYFADFYFPLQLD